MAVEEAAGQDDFVRVLISAGARPDTRNPVLETIPFHEAVRKHDPELLKLLIRNVRDINIQDGCGSTALHIATEELIDADQVNNNLTYLFPLIFFVRRPGTSLWSALGCCFSAREWRSTLRT